MQITKKHSSVLCRITAFLLCLVCVTAVFSSMPQNRTSAVITDADIKAMEEKINKNNQKIKEYEAKIAALKKDLTSTISLKNEIDKQIAVMQENIDDTNKLIDSYTEQIAVKMAEIEGKESQYSTDYSAFLDMMRIYYEDNTTNYLDMILGANSFGDFLTQLERIGSLLSLQQTLMKELNQETIDLVGMKDQLQTMQLQAESLRQQQVEDEKALENKRASTQNLIATLQNDQSVASRSLREAQKLDDDLDAQLTKLLKDLEEQNRSTYAGGSLLWPVDADLNYVSSKFGWRTLFGQRDNHRGIDIIKLGGCNGRNIYASNSGTVVTATLHSSYGNYVLINHGGGIATLYAHCSKLLVSAGDTVTKGQTIALVGTTGQSTGPHLHYEVRVNGTIIDPLSAQASVAYPSNLIVEGAAFKR